jgi:hypothetical protein
MNATVTLPRLWSPAEHKTAEMVPYLHGRDMAQEQVAELWIEGIPLQHCHGGVLRVLAKAEERAAWAERRLRSRLIELTWPATLGAFTGGFAAVVALRLAGM